EDAVRIGTYNVQFLSGILGRAGSPCLIGPGDNDDFERPKVIADRVKASGYDIIAFNEVFDATAQERFVAEMKGTYPHYVEKLDLDTSNQEDSGLMIFSRWEFEPSTIPPPRAGTAGRATTTRTATRSPFATTPPATTPIASRRRASRSCASRTRTRTGSTTWPSR